MTYKEEMIMNKIGKRLLAIVLCFAMALSLAVSVSATEATDETRGPEKAKPGIYDFVLEEQYVWIDRDRFSGKSPHSVHTINAVDAYYEDGTLNWKYVADNIAFMQSETVQANSATAFGSTDTYKWRGLRLGAITRYDGKKSYPAGYWYAFSFKAPEPGLYDVNLDFMYREDGAKVAEVYYLDSLYTDSILIDRELNESTMIATVDFSGKSEDGKTYLPKSTALGQINVTEEEFVLVFRAAEKVSDASCCYMVINGITLTPAAGSVDKTPSKGPMKADNDMTLYLIAGGAAVLVAASVVVILVATKKKKK